MLTYFFSLISPLAIPLICFSTFEILSHDCATRLALLNSCSGLVYDRPTTNTIVLSPKMLMLLAGSRRHGGCSCRRVGLEPSQGLFAVPIQPRGHTTVPRSYRLSVRLERWSGWMRKEEKACQNANLPRSQQHEEKSKKSKRYDEPDPTIYTVLCVGGSSPCLLPTSHRLPRATLRHATKTQAKAATGQPY